MACNSGGAEAAGQAGNDFPFYNGRPQQISSLQWLFVLAMVVAGFLVAIAPVPSFATRYGQFIPAVLFLPSL